MGGELRMFLLPPGNETETSDDACAISILYVSVAAIPSRRLFQPRGFSRTMLRTTRNELGVLAHDPLKLPTCAAAGQATTAAARACSPIRPSRERMLRCTRRPAH